MSIALGLALLAMAPARFVAEIAVLQARAPIIGAEKGVLVPLERLLAAAEGMTREARSGWSGSAGELAGRGRVMLALYRDPTAPEGVAELAAAAAAFRVQLSVAPADAQTWSRLAYAEYARGRFQEASSAWRVSIVTGPFDPALMASRLEAGLALRPYMDVAARDALATQIALYWRWDPDGLTSLARRFDAAAVFRPALAGDPLAAAEFERRLARRPGAR